MAHATASYTGAKPVGPRLLTSAVLGGLGRVGRHTDLPRAEVAGLIHVNPADSLKVLSAWPVLNRSMRRHIKQ